MVPGMHDTATIRTDAGAGYTVIAKTGLRCRMSHVSANSGTTGFDRSELAGRRRFLWDDTDYAMPSDCQIEVNGDGNRWNPVADNAFGTFDGPNGQPVYRAVDVVVAG